MINNIKYKSLSPTTEKGVLSTSKQNKSFIVRVLSNIKSLYKSTVNVTPKTQIKPSNNRTSNIDKYDINYIKQELQNNIENILNGKNNDSIYHFNATYTVFKLKSLNNIIFKTRYSKDYANTRIINGSRTESKNLSYEYCKARYDKYKKVKSLVEQPKYNLLLLPETKMISIDYKEDKVYFCIEEELDVHEMVFKNDHALSAITNIEMDLKLSENAKRYKPVLTQLGNLIVEARVDDVAPRNFPLIKINTENENDPFRIGLVDIEHFFSCFRGEKDMLATLFAPQQYISTMKSGNAVCIRKKELQRRKQLNKYHAKKHFKTGFEKIAQPAMMTEDEFDNIIKIVSKMSPVEGVINWWKNEGVFKICEKARKKFKDSKFEVLVFKNVTETPISVPRFNIDSRGNVNTCYPGFITKDAELMKIFRKKLSSKVMSKKDAIKKINGYVRRYVELFNAIIERNKKYSPQYVESKRAISLHSDKIKKIRKSGKLLGFLRENNNLVLRFNGCNISYIVTEFLKLKQAIFDRQNRLMYIQA